MNTVSIITTFYNAQNYILKCIFSVIAQKYDSSKLHVEYILVNDASTDNSLDIVKNYINLIKCNIDFNIYNLETNVGCGAARKYGIEKSTGDYLMFLDADDYYINDDFIERAFNDINNSNADIVEYGVKYNINDKIINNCVNKDIIIENRPNIALVYLFKDNIIKINVWSKIIRKSLIDTHPYSTLREFEDVDTIPYWVFNASKIIIKSSIEINYRQTNKSITSNMNHTRYLTIKTMLQYFDVFKNYKDVLKAIYNRALIDFKIMLNGKTSYDTLFNEFSELNTYMLKYIYPNDYVNMTYNVEINK